MRKENRKEGLRGNKSAIAPVVGEIIMIAITVGLAAVVATFVYGYGGSLVYKPMPVFTVSRKGDTVSVVLHDKGGADKIERLLVQSPQDVKDNDILDNDSPTGEIEIGNTLKTEGVEAGAHYVVNATVDGDNRVVIDRWM